MTSVIALIGAVLCTTALVWGWAATSASAGQEAEPGDIASTNSEIAAVPAADPSAYEILEVFLSEEEAVRAIFPEADAFVRRTVALDSGAMAAIGELSGHPWTGTVEPVVYTVEQHGGRTGYAVVMDEIGKHHFITFLVGVTPERRVQAVEILVYRESRGGEVQRKRFLRQFRGKQLDDPIKRGRDIVNITGATLSVNAVSRGVRKALALVEAMETSTVGAQ